MFQTLQISFVRLVNFKCLLSFQFQGQIHLEGTSILINDNVRTYVSSSFSFGRKKYYIFYDFSVSHGMIFSANNNTTHHDMVIVFCQKITHLVRTKCMKAGLFILTSNERFLQERFFFCCGQNTYQFLLLLLNC